MTTFKNCGNCRFSVAAQGPDGKINFKQRMCKWGPPVHVMLPTPQGLMANCFWPTLDVAAHCYRHEPIPGQEGNMPAPEGSA